MLVINLLDYKEIVISRSKHKTPIICVTKCESEKKDKQKWHRIMRRTEKVHLQNNYEDVDMVMLDKYQFSDSWNMGKDGKIYRPSFVNERKLMSK